MAPGGEFVRSRRIGFVAAAASGEAASVRSRIESLFDALSPALAPCPSSSLVASQPSSSSLARSSAAVASRRATRAHASPSRPPLRADAGGRVGGESATASVSSREFSSSSSDALSATMYRRSRVRPGTSAVIRRKWMSAPAIIKGRVVVKNPKGAFSLELELGRGCC